MKRFVKEYLTFSKRDRIGIISLLVLVLIIYLLPLFFSKNSSVSISEDSTLAKIIKNNRVFPTNKRVSLDDSAVTVENATDFHPTPGYENGALFSFDPNTLPADGWQKLGLPEKTIKTLIHFREKAGKFYKKEDLKKVWGLPQGFYERIQNYIDIPSSKKTDFSSPEIIKKERKVLDLDINAADSNAFIALPGIGIKLAARIINFRNKLGGFYSINQVGETYGLRDSVFQAIKPFLHVGDPRLKKVNINTATVEDLKSHPYIKWNLANALVAYRTQHGSYNKLDDIKKIGIISDSVYTKISPYLYIQ